MEFEDVVNFLTGNPIRIPRRSRQALDMRKRPDGVWEMKSQPKQKQPDPTNAYITVAEAEVYVGNSPTIIILDDPLKD